MRVVVVGGGILGLATAYEALKAGDDVTVLEARTVGTAASYGNAMLISLAQPPTPAPGVVAHGLKMMMHPDSPLYVAPSLRPEHVGFMLAMARKCNAEDYKAGTIALLELASGTLDLFDGYVADGMEFEMHEEGVLRLFTSRAELEHAWADAELFTAAGVHVERLDSNAQIRALEPSIAAKYTHAIHLVTSRHLDPGALLHSLAARIRSLGGAVLERRKVTGFARSGDSVTTVKTALGEFEADAVVLTAGVWTSDLTKSLGVRVPINPGKGYHVDYTPAPAHLTRGLILEDVHAAIAPLEGKIRVAGTMEFGRRNEEVNAVRVEALRRAAKASFTSWEPQDDGIEWAGMRPMTPDGLPVIGRLAPLENVFIASGHAMAGLSQGPATARALVNHIHHQAPIPAAAAFDPARFARRR